MDRGASQEADTVQWSVTDVRDARGWNLTSGHHQVGNHTSGHPEVLYTGVCNYHLFCEQVGLFSATLSIQVVILLSEGFHTSRVPF